MSIWINLSRHRSPTRTAGTRNFLKKYLNYSIFQWKKPNSLLRVDGFFLEAAPSSLLEPVCSQTHLDISAILALPAHSMCPTCVERGPFWHNLHIFCVPICVERVLFGHIIWIGFICGEGSPLWCNQTVFICIVGILINPVHSS